MLSGTSSTPVEPYPQGGVMVMYQGGPGGTGRWIGRGGFRGRGWGPAGGIRGGRCFYCQEERHWARDCPYAMEPRPEGPQRGRGGACAPPSGARGGLQRPSHQMPVHSADPWRGPTQTHQ